jgi:hypothetical protein
MAAVPIDGRVRVTNCASIANIAAPTVAELNAGTAIEGYILPDGLDIDVETGTVNLSNLGSTFTNEGAGRRKPTVNISFHHEGPGSDVPYLLYPFRTNAFIVVRRGTDRTIAWTIADKVEVYPVQAGEAKQTKPAVDGTWDFTIPFKVSADPNTRAVVA